MLALLWQYEVESVIGQPTNHHEQAIDAHKSSDACIALSITIHSLTLMSTNKGNTLAAAGQLD